MKIYRIVGHTGDGYENSYTWTARTYLDKNRADELVKNLNVFIEKVFERSKEIKLIFPYYINEEKNEEDEDEKEKREQIKKEALENFLNTKKEFETTKYDTINVIS